VPAGLGRDADEGLGRAPQRVAPKPIAISTSSACPNGWFSIVWSAPCWLAGFVEMPSASRIASTPMMA